MFSIIIPCFNNIRFLRATLASIAWQEFDGEFEVIIVDNNSTHENPDSIYHEYFERLHLYLIKQPKLPHTYALCKARNTALKIARHPWIISLDADIVLNQHYLRALKDLVNHCGNAMITAERIFIDGSNAHEIEGQGKDWPEAQEKIRSPANYYLPEDRRLPTMRDLGQVEHPWAYMHGCNVIFPRELALAIGGYDEAYDGNWGYEDVDFAYRLIESDAAPLYCEHLYCYHLENPPTKAEEIKRFDKVNNPNWQRICSRIPGFKEYKEHEYRKISESIKLAA